MNDVMSLTLIKCQGIISENVKLKEKVNIAEEALLLARSFYEYCEKKHYPCVDIKDFQEDKKKLDQAFNKIKEH